MNWVGFRNGFRSLALVIIFWIGAGIVCAQCTKLSRNYTGSPFLGDTIGLIAKSGVSEKDIDNAVSIWQQGCGAMYAVGRLPRLLTNRKGERNVYVTRYETIAPRPRVCGLFTRDRIEVWAFTTLDKGLIPCPAVEYLVAHEIGHALGLGDADEDPSCSGQLMAQISLPSLTVPAVKESECKLATLANTPKGLPRGEMAQGDPFGLGRSGASLGRLADWAKVRFEYLPSEIVVVDAPETAFRSSHPQAPSSNGEPWSSHRPSQPWSWDRNM